MRKHGRGSKHQYVRKYPRWVRGERKHVDDHKRGADPVPSNKDSELQLRFDFDPPGTAR